MSILVAIDFKSRSFQEAGYFEMIIDSLPVLARGK